MPVSLIAQGELGLPVFVGTMQFSTRAVIERVKTHYAGKVDPGDVFIVNDPYLGGTHLMDVRFAAPFFVDGELFCWLSNTGHWPDTGGMVPGGTGSFSGTGSGSVGGRIGWSMFGSGVSGGVGMLIVVASFVLGLVRWTAGTVN